MSHPRERSHPVDPSRATQHDNVPRYRAGYQAGRADARAGRLSPGQRAAAGGKPPRRNSCPIQLLLLPLLLLAALWRRNRTGGPR